MPPERTFPCVPTQSVGKRWTAAVQRKEPRMLAALTGNLL